MSSGKINKYEYLTDEEILPSNQKQIIEQAKFTYSPLGKAFEKQIKTIEDQGGKQIKAIQNQGQVKTIKKYTYDDEDSPLISKQKEIFNKLVDERLEEITKLDKEVNPDDLIYRYNGSTADEKFNEFDNAFGLLDKMRDGKISLVDAKNDQVEFKSNLNEIKKGSKTHRLKNKKNAFYNIEMFYKARNKGIAFFDDYSSMVSETESN